MMFRRFRQVSSAESPGLGVLLDAFEYKVKLSFANTSKKMAKSGSTKAKSEIRKEKAKKSCKKKYYP